jgi:hypothetical protein
MCEDPGKWERLAWWLHFVEPFEYKGRSCAVALHKPGQNGSKTGGPPPSESSAGFLRDFNDLREFLCATSWPDGSARQPGTLLVMTGGSKWTLKVRDPNGSRYAFYSANTLPDAMAGLDLGLGADDLDWREDKPIRDRR